MAAETLTLPSEATAPPTAVLRGVLSSRRRSLLLWSSAVAVVTAIYVGFYPAMGDAEAIEPFLENMPEALVEAMGYDQIATPGGYLASTVFGLLGPALLLVFGIGWGARLIAGAEEDGTLELEAAHPVSRRQVYVERLAALWTGLAVLAAVVFATTWVLVRAFGIAVGVGEIAAGSVGLLLLALAMSTVALAVGAATGRRAVAAAAGAGLAVLAFLGDAIGPLVGGLGWLTDVSPWSWYAGGDPLLDGFDPVGFPLLAALAAIAAFAGLVGYRGRDLGV